MMAENALKVEIITTETIKPSSPTPSHLKTFKLSLMEQIHPVVYGPLLFFYSKSDLIITSDQRSQRLKSSLSETLARFYPAAGRLNNNTAIECTDEGAHYIEARCETLLSDIVSQPSDYSVNLRKLLPVAAMAQKARSLPLLLVQATLLGCGGYALGVCLSHKFADGITLGNFMKSWAEASRGSKCRPSPVLFGAASLFPPREPSTTESAALALDLKGTEKVVAKRFVFEKEKIAPLKALAASKAVPNPSRVEITTALIWKCAMTAMKKKKKKLAVTQSINIRKWADPPFPENLAGSLVGHFAVEANHRCGEPEPELIKHLVAELRKGLRAYVEDKGNRLRGQRGRYHHHQEEAYEVVLQDLREARELFSRSGTNGTVMIFTSLCNFQLSEGVDFGWGSPVWVTPLPGLGIANVVKLMDKAGGGGCGVEAWVTLSEEDMILFEREYSQLLQFSDLPSTYKNCTHSKM